MILQELKNLIFLVGIQNFQFEKKIIYSNKFFSMIEDHIKDVFIEYGWVFDPSKVKCTSMGYN